MFSGGWGDFVHVPQCLYTVKMVRPFVTREHAISLASEIFNLDIDSSSQSAVKELGSYDDRNFYVRGTKEGIEREYVLKVSNSDDSEYEGLLEELNTVMLHLDKGGIPCSVPQQTASGKYLELRQFTAMPDSHPVKRAKKDEKEPVLHKHAVRLFTFMPGKTMRDVPNTTDLCFKVGSFAAEVHKVLKVRCVIINVFIFQMSRHSAGGKQIFSQELCGSCFEVHVVSSDWFLLNVE